MAVAALAVITLAACGSTGGGLGDIFGGGQSGTNELRGRVDYVDVNNRYVVLTNVSGYGNMLSNSSGTDTLRVYFDNSTAVEYQGQRYNVTDLERGDEVAVQYDQSGNNVNARAMTVLYDSSSGSGGSNYPGGGGAYESTVRGTVRNVDASRRTIEIERSGYGVQTFEYDANTAVMFNNRNYDPRDLERGDEVEIRIQDIGGGRFMANNITVLRSVSGGSGSYGSQSSTIRGTVRYVDASRREIGIEQASWISGFNTGAGAGTSTMVIRYDANTSVLYNNQMYAPTNLERGDVIEVQVQNTGTSSLLANRITVVRDVNYR